MLRRLWKKSRALNFSLLENKKEFSRGKKRITPPGQHGAKRKRFSDYANQNREKQKIRFLYGLKENQLGNLFAKLKKQKGNIGDNLLINCETRLDNLVFRSGLTNTRSLARQLVSHGHFLVDNGQKVQKVKSPSYQVKPNNIISLRKEKMRENKLIKTNLQQNNPCPAYVNLDKEKLTITYLRYPLVEELNKEINTSLVVEWYNKKI